MGRQINLLVVSTLILTYLTTFTHAALPERCTLPAHSGPCKALMPRFHYNADLKQCEEFSYGGCQGNANNFMTREECERVCVQSQNDSATVPNVPPAAPVAETGSSANNAVASAGPNPSTVAMPNLLISNNFTNGQPIPPVLPGGAMPGDGGTFQRQKRQTTVVSDNGNGTVTLTTGDTESNVTIGTADAKGLVIVPQANTTVVVESPTTASTDNSSATTNITVEVPNTTTEVPTTEAPPTVVVVVPPPTSDRSLNSTDANTTAVDSRAGDVPKPCLQPSMTGPCRALFERFYFNSKSGRCEQFIWGGCDPNDNNFESVGDCNEACLGQRSPASGRASTDNAKQQDSTETFRTLDANTNAVTKIYGRPTNLNTEFDAAAARLRLKQAAMDELATDSESFRNLPMDAQAVQKIQREEVDEETNAAIMQHPPRVAASSYSFVNKVGAVDENLAVSTDEGHEGENSVEPIQPPLKCQLQQLTGPCDGKIKRYFFNNNDQRCEPFMYGGCQANANNFLSQEQCMQECVVSPTTAAQRGPRPPPMGGDAFRPQQIPQRLIPAPPPPAPSSAYGAPAPPANMQYFRAPSPPPQSFGTFERHTAPPPQMQQPQQFYNQPPPQSNFVQQREAPLNQPSYGGPAVMSSAQAYQSAPAIDWRANAGAQRAYRHLLTTRSASLAQPPTQPQVSFGNRAMPDGRSTMMLRMTMPVAQRTGGFEWRSLRGVRAILGRNENGGMNKQMLDDEAGQQTTPGPDRVDIA